MPCSLHMCNLAAWKAAYVQPHAVIMQPSGVHVQPHAAIIYKYCICLRDVLCLLLGYYMYILYT